MNIKYVEKIEGSPVVKFIASAWVALMADGQWDSNSVLISPELQCVFAMTDTRRIIGCLTFHVDDTQSVVNIAYVHPEFRGKGVYAEMHSKFLEVSGEQGATKALNICYPTNAGIQATCKKLGYIPYVIHWTLDIPQSEAA